MASLSVEASTIGIAAAVNCLVIVGLQWAVVKATGHITGAGLLIVVGIVWAASWLLLELALFTDRDTASLLFVIAFATFAVGETMYAPVLSPLAAAVAPQDLVGTTLGLLAALRTGISATGPLVAGLLLAFDLPHLFVLGHVAINALAAVLSWRLLRNGVGDRPGVDNAEEVEEEATASTRSAHV
ncbi:MAG: hypothetical protein WKF82_06475 [Nocardioidaceae bacterium]